jgi:hypothetical protein
MTASTTTRIIPSSTGIAEYFTIEEVAAILKVSTDTASRRFGNERGVIDLGTPETRTKRRHRVLRVPRITLERVIAECQVR